MNQIASRCGFACVVLWIAAAGCSSKSSSSGDLSDGGTGTGSSTTSSSTGTGSTGTGSGTTATTTSGTGGGDNCAAACAKLDAANCPGDMPGECAMTLCATPACVTQRETLATCILGATITCAPDGNGAGSAACNDPLDAYVNCLIASGG